MRDFFLFDQLSSGAGHIQFNNITSVPSDSEMEKDLMASEYVSIIYTNRRFPPKAPFLIHSTRRKMDLFLIHSTHIKIYDSDCK